MMDFSSKPFELLRSVSRSEATFSVYNRYLKVFFAYLEPYKIDVDGFLALSDEKRTEIIRDYLIEYRKNHNPNSVQPIYSGIIKFCKANRVKADKEYLRVHPAKGKDCAGQALGQ